MRSDLAEVTIEIRNDHLLINGQPTIVLAGEVHYFRLTRDQWADRVDKLKAAGANAVASYIPWLWHELPPWNDSGCEHDYGATRQGRL